MLSAQYKVWMVPSAGEVTCRFQNVLKMQKHYYDALTWERFLRKITAE